MGWKVSQDKGSRWRAPLPGAVWQTSLSGLNLGTSATLAFAIDLQAIVNDHVNIL